MTYTFLFSMQCLSYLIFGAEHKNIFFYPSKKENQLDVPHYAVLINDEYKK